MCDGTGEISLDVQFLPDVDIPCPQCRGSRYSRDAESVRHESKQGAAYTLPELMDMDVSEALNACADMKAGKPTPSGFAGFGAWLPDVGRRNAQSSGGEAQRLKLASEMGRAQGDSVFVFDEPTIGLHPLDVQTLLRVFETLIESGATVIVIEHDLDVIRSADYIIDMGPGGGAAGGKIVAWRHAGRDCRKPRKLTGRFLERR